MKQILKPIPILSCIIVLLLLISVSKTKHINTLENEITVFETNFWIDQAEFMDDALQYECGEKVKLIDSLYIEISTIGMELDSMKLKYDN